MEYRATLVRPAHSASLDANVEPEVGLPLLLCFAGLAGSARTVVEKWAVQFAAVAPMPFVLAAPERPVGSWWCIDDDSHWGWAN